MLNLEGPPPSGVFISGTDTGVGKTVVAAGVLRLIAESRPSIYWKPVQTGEDSDTHEVARLAGRASSLLPPPAYVFPAPRSPHLAAKLAGDRIHVGVLNRRFGDLAHQSFTVVEGAGGLLVPLNDSTLMIDLPRRWFLPVILVAADRLGAINQTLLSIEACRQRGLEVLGVVWNLATEEFGNAEAVEEISGVPNLGRFFKSSPEDLVRELPQVPALQKLFIGQ